MTLTSKASTCGDSLARGDFYKTFIRTKVAKMLIRYTNIPGVLLEPDRGEGKVGVVLVVGTAVDTEPDPVAVPDPAPTVNPSPQTFPSY